jgi:hypothetical protein
LLTGKPLLWSLSLLLISSALRRQKSDHNSSTSKYPRACVFPEKETNFKWEKIDENRSIKICRVWKVEKAAFCERFERTEIYELELGCIYDQKGQN